MMSDPDTFSDNPFRKLDAKRFPAKRHCGGAGAAARPSAPRRAADAGDDAEAELFLAAMRRGAPAETVPPGGFFLADACPLESVASRKKRRRGREGKAERGAAVADDAAATAAGTAAAAPLEPAPVPEPDEESAAFLRAMGDARPLAGRGREVAPAAETVPPPPGSELSFRELMEGTLEFAVSFSDEYLEGHVVGLDPLIMGRLRSGTLSPEAHLDLHGLNAVQAFETLRDFMRGAWYRSLRVVLIVPGRGRNSPQGQGVLREKLQLWLTQEPFKRVVLAFCTARPHDGGPGSIYVLLRKFRKKGRICWERMPMDSDLV